ncbi:Protein of unknown function [Gryllus bimaculatus]|nr:Protein of unknown function [Gryllus bimaculatus]
MCQEVLSAGHRQLSGVRISEGPGRRRFSPVSLDRPAENAPEPWRSAAPRSSLGGGRRGEARRDAIKDLVRSHTRCPASTRPSDNYIYLKSQMDAVSSRRHYLIQMFRLGIQKRRESIKVSSFAEI